MADPSSISSSFYVKNYRAQRVRLNQKYSGSTSVLNRDEVKGGGSSASAWGRPGFGSTLSLAGDSAGGSGHALPHYHYFHGPNWTPKVSLVSAVKLAGFHSAAASRDPPGNVNHGNHREGSVSASTTSSALTLPSSPYHHRPPPTEYRRTLSGGAEWRSNSADPEYTFNLYRSPARNGCWEDPGRCTSAERPSDYLYNGARSFALGTGSGGSYHHGFGLSQNGNSSTSMMSLDRIRTRADSDSIGDGRVTALARNVSSYTWERPDFHEPGSNVNGNGIPTTHGGSGHGGAAYGKAWNGNSETHVRGKGAVEVKANGLIDANPPRKEIVPLTRSGGQVDEGEEGQGGEDEEVVESRSWTKKRRRVRNPVPSFLGPEDHLTLARVSSS